MTDIISEPVSLENKSNEQFEQNGDLNSHQEELKAENNESPHNDNLETNGDESQTNSYKNQISFEQIQNDQEQEQENISEKNIKNQENGEMSNGHENIENVSQSNHSEKQSERVNTEQDENQSQKKIDKSLEKSNEVIIEEEQKEKEEQDKKQPPSLTPLEMAQHKLKEADQLKEQARMLVQQKDFKGASMLYEQALQVLNPSFFRTVQDQEIIKQFVEISNMLLNNLSFIHFNLQNFNVAIQFANQVLITDSTNVKSYYRKAVCYKKLEDYERAFEEIKKAAQYNQTSSKKLSQNDINNEYVQIKQLYKEYLAKNRENEKEVYSKMLSSTKINKSSNTNNNPSTLSQKNKNSTQNDKKNDINLNLSKSIFENIKQVKSDEKTFVCFLGSSIAGVCYPLALGADFQDVRCVSGTLGLCASIFGLSRLQGIYTKLFFATSTTLMLTILYKISPKAIKN